MDALHIGIDVSKGRLDAASTFPSVTGFHMPRNHNGLADRVERLKALDAERIAIEATGGFEAVMVAALATAGPVVVVNPVQVLAVAHALDKRAKGDPDRCFCHRSHCRSHQTGLAVAARLGNSGTRRSSLTDAGR